MKLTGFDPKIPFSFCFSLSNITDNIDIDFKCLADFLTESKKKDTINIKYPYVSFAHLLAWTFFQYLLVLSDPWLGCMVSAPGVHEAGQTSP